MVCSGRNLRHVCNDFSNANGELLRDLTLNSKYKNKKNISHNTAVRLSNVFCLISKDHFVLYYIRLNGDVALL